MEIKLENLDGSKVKVTAEIDAKDVDAEVKRTYKDFANRYNFPGFRKGKAPRPVVDNALGQEMVMATVTENVINNAYPQIIEEKQLFPAGQPQFGDSGMVEPGKAFSFDFELPVKPEVEIASYEPVEIELPVSKASEADIDDQVEGFLKHYNVEEATDEFAKDTMGFEDLADMREQIAHTIEEQKAQIMPRLKENASQLKLAERYEGEIPPEMAEEKEAELLQDFFTQLQRQGMSFDAYLNAQGIDNDQFKEDVKKQAIDECRQMLALDAWARHYGMEVTDEDLLHEFEAARVDNPKKVMEDWRKQGRLYLIREGVLRTKAIKDVMDKAKVTEVDFAAINRAEKDKEDEK